MLLMGSADALSRSLNRVLAIEISRQLAITSIALKRYTSAAGLRPPT